MHLTLIKGGRRPAAIPAPPAFPEHDSRRHPNPLLRHLVAEAREQLPASGKRLNAELRTTIAAGGALATLDYLCTHLKETSDMVGPRGVIARSLAMIIAQLEDHHA